MDYGDLCDCVMRLYLYADATKIIHYTTDSHHTHELCDEVRDAITDFADDFAEKAFGLVKKPDTSDFSSGLPLEKIDSLEEVCDRCIDLMTLIKVHIEDEPKFDGIVSLIDDFNGEMAQKKFLATFDHNVNYKY